MFAISYLGVKDHVHIKGFQVEGATHSAYTRNKIVTHCNQKKEKASPKPLIKMKKVGCKSIYMAAFTCSLYTKQQKPLISSMMQQLDAITNKNADQWNHQIICTSPKASICITCCPIMHQISLQLATLEDKCVPKRDSPDAIHFLSYLFTSAYVV